MKPILRHFLLLMSAMLLAFDLSAQHPSSKKQIPPSNWILGVGLGGRVNFMNITKLDPELGGSKQSRFGTAFSVFTYKDTENGQFAIRPQLSFVSRGAKYIGFHSKAWTDAEYNVKASYMDFRLPVIVNFGTYRRGNIQPYVYFAPIVGMATGGEISMSDAKGDGFSVSTNVAKSNLSSLYFGAGAAFGAKYNWTVNDRRLYLGLEVMYDCGLSNTYGKKEKDGEAIDLARIVDNSSKTLDGKRMFSGLEFQMVVGIPLYKSKDKAKHPVPPQPLKALRIIKFPAIDKIVIDEDISILDDEKTCYQLDEVKIMIANGENVIGKKICAVDNKIQFDFGSDKIKPESYDYLNELSKILKGTGADIKINGHTDNRGTDSYNMKLSADRAKSVLNYLISQGIEPEKLSYEGFGFHRPISTNDTEEGRSLNRRVEFEILGNTDDN